MQENANAFVNKWVNFGGEHAAVHANNFRFKRQIYFRLEKYLREFLDGKPTQRLVVMPGLRGTGKTVVMHQLHTWLRKEYLLPPHRVVYMPLDEARMFGVGLKEAFGVYEKYHLGGSALCTKDRVVLFIDEVHYDPGWALAAKTIHDYAPNVFLLITGSAALDLALSPDIARRARIERIFPLNFQEYLMLKYEKTLVDLKTTECLRNGFFSPDAQTAELFFREAENHCAKEIARFLPATTETVIEDYMWFGGLPYLLSTREFRQCVDAVLKVVQYDIPHMANLETRTLTKLPALLLSLTTGPDVSIETLSRKLQLSQESVLQALELFTMAELIFFVDAKGILERSARLSRRKYFATSSITAALLSYLGEDPGKHSGLLLETCVASHLHQWTKMETGIGLFYHRTKGGADFLLKTPGNRVAVEVCMGGKGKHGIAQVHRTMKDTHANFGVVVSADVENVEAKGNVILIPAFYALLL